MTVSQSFRKRPISAAVSAAICSMVLATSVQAAPTGGQVVGGSGSISQSGATTTINQASQNMAINWQSYNVNSNETVQYKQPNTSSISLNRILSNDGSTIAGHINANGNVILVNPNGVFFTPTAVVNVGGIIASGLDIQPDDFMNGKYIFNSVDGKNGTVVNTGTINASLGGNVALLGKKVENDGLIAAKLGTVSLAAGKQAVLTFDSGGILGVRVSKAILQKDIGVNPAVLNKGKIQAAGGRVLLTASTSQDVFSQAVNTGNIQQATSVVVNADGSFTLGSGADTVNTGSIDTSTTKAGQSAGQIAMLGNNVTSSGSLKANATSGNGGNIELHSTDTTLLTQNSNTSAQSDNGGVGGVVKVLGDKIGLFDQSTVNVSGANGGGQALIGGDEHGANSNIQNASDTIVAPNASIYADGIDNGNGGKVIVWSGGVTQYFGNLYTRGGAGSGDGGFAEVSGKKGLLFNGNANSSAVNGNQGTLLLDPDTILVDGCRNVGVNACGPTSAFSTSSGTTTLGFDATPTTFRILPSTLDTLLDSNNVVLDAATDIDINGAVSPSSGDKSLTLKAGNNIKITASVTLNGAFKSISGISTCGATLTCNYSAGDTDISAAISASTINIVAANNLNVDSGGSMSATSTTVTPSISADVGNDITLKDTLLSQGGAVTLTAGDGSLYTNGTTQLPSATTVTGDIVVNAGITTSDGNFTATAGEVSSPGVGTFTNSSPINAGAGTVNITTYGSNGTFGQNLGSITAGSITAKANNGVLTQSTSSSQYLDITDVNGTATFFAGDNEINLSNTYNNILAPTSLETTETSAASPIIFNNSASSTILGTITAAGPITITATNDLSLTDAIDITDTNASSIGKFYFGSASGNTFTATPNISLLDNAATGITVYGNTGNDTFSLGTPFNSTLIGGGGADTLAAPNAGSGNQNTWTISGNDAGTFITANTSTPSTPLTGTGTVNFSGFAMLKGGTDTDAFQITGDTSGEMILDGNGGSQDSLVFGTGVASSISVGLLNALPSSLTTPSSTNTNLFTVYQVGAINNNSGQSASLFGQSVSGNTWTINDEAVTPSTVQWSGTSPNVYFTGFNNITAGDSGDIFHITSNYAGTITGGAGVDKFYIDTPNIAVQSLVGTGSGDTLYGPNGSADTNDWTINSSGGGYLNSNGGSNAVNFSSMTTLKGGAGSDNFVISSTSTTSGSITNIDGVSSANNSLKGLNNTNSTWQITRGNSGQVAVTGGAAYVTQFSNIQTLTGGSAGNNFVLAGGTIGGIVGGGTSPQDTITGDTRSLDWYVTGDNTGYLTLHGSSTPVVGNFSNIADLTGGATTIDTFYINAGINNIDDSATSTSTINVNNGGTISGSIQAGIGTDKVIVALGGKVTGPITLNDAVGNTGEVDVSGTAGAIIGGSGDDTYNINASVSSIDDSGSSASTINVNNGGSVTGAIRAGIGIDKVTVALGGSAGSVALNNAAGKTGQVDVSGTVSGAVTGGAGVDTFNINAGVGSIDDSASSGSTVNVNNGGAVTGAIKAGTGTDKVTVALGGSAGSIALNDGAGKTGQVDIAGTVGGAVSGGAGNDAFTVDGAAGSINTGLGSDTVTLASPAVITSPGNASTAGVIGGSGADSLAVQSAGNDWKLTSSNAGSVTNGTATLYFNGFTNISGTSNDTLDYSADTAAITVDLNTPNSWIGTVIGNYGTGAAGTTIIGWNSGTNNWSIGAVGTPATDGVNDGTVSNGANSLTFENVTELDGGDAGASSINNFAITSSGAFNGLINGSGAGVNTLTARGDLDNVWTVNPSNSTLAYNTGSAVTTTFNAMQNLNGGGGAGANTFNVGASLSSIISNGSGNNTITVSAGNTVSNGITTGTGTDQITVAGTVSSIQAGNGNKTVTVNAGGKVNNSVTVGTGTDNLTLDASSGATAGGIIGGSISAGDGANTITVASGANVNGDIVSGSNATSNVSKITVDGNVAGKITAEGTGANQFYISGNVGNTITGGGSKSSLDVTASGKNVQIGTKSVGPIPDYTTVAMGTITATSSDTLIWGSGDDSTWTVATAGNSVADGATSFTTAFSGFANLYGGTAKNTFNIDTNIGNITAGGTTDSVTVTGSTTNVGAISLTGSAGNSIAMGGVSGALAVNGAGANTITVSGTDNSTVSATGIGSGAANIVNVSGTVKGLITGAGSNSTLNVTGAGKNIQIGTTSVGPTPSYTAVDMGNITATSGSTTPSGDTLIWGSTDDSAWTVATAGNSVTDGRTGFTTAFSGFANLYGGAGNNTFNINNNIGNITANGNTDKVTVSNVSAGAIALAGSGDNTITMGGTGTGALSVRGNGVNQITVSGTVTGPVSAIGTGTNANNTVSVTGSINGSNGSVNVTGAGTNTVNLSGSVSGVITGDGTNNSTLNISSPDKTVQLGTSAVTGETPSYRVNKFGYINAVNDPGGRTDENGNTLIGYNNSTSSTWNINSVNSGTVVNGTNTTHFKNFANYVSGPTTAGDAFIINNNGTSSTGEITGWIDGSTSQDGGSITINSNAAFEFNILGSKPGSQIYYSPSSNVVSEYGVINLLGGPNTISLSLNTNNVWDIRGDNIVDLYSNGATTPTATIQNTGGKNTLFNISGGQDNDTFIWESTGSISGVVNGGTGGVNTLIIPSTNSGEKTVVLGGSTINLGTRSLMNISGIQNVIANNAYANTLVGSNLQNVNWSVEPVNITLSTNNSSLSKITATSIAGAYDSGQVFDGVQNTTFKGFANLQSGTGANTYTSYSDGRLSGYIEGNGAGDKFVVDPTEGSSQVGVQLLNAPLTTITLLTNTTATGPQKFSLYNIDQVEGNDSSATANDSLSGMASATATDTWTIDAVNGGQLSNGTTTVQFSGFGNLVGNTGNDEFDVNSGGAVSGIIQANGGSNDVLNVALTGQESGQISFNGDGSASVNLLGGSNTATAYSATYNPAVAIDGVKYDQLQYSSGGNVYTVNYTNAATVNDNVTANSLDINGVTGSSNSFTLRNIPSTSTLTGSNPLAVQVNTLTPLNIANTQALSVNGGGTDSVALPDSLNLPGMTLSLSGQSLTQGGGTSLTASSLELDNFTAVGGSGAGLSTAVGQLMINNAGPVYIDQQGALVLAGMNTTGLLDISTNGAVSNSANLISSGDLTINTANSKDINLTGANQLTGLISLNANNISLSNSADTKLGNVTAAGKLSMTGTGNLTQSSGTIIANGATTLNFGNGDISLDGANNNFNTVTVNGGNNVSLNDVDSIGLNTLTAKNVSITAGTNITDASGGTATNITADKVTLHARTGIGGGSIQFSQGNGFTIDTSNPITTKTGSLSAFNTASGTINITNSGALTVHDLRNHGDIILNNTSGDVTFAVTDVKNANGIVTGSLGAIDANYGGSNADPVFAGSVALYGNGNNSVYTLGYGYSEADITGENLYVEGVNQFGTAVQPIRLNIRNQATLLTGGGGISEPFGPPKSITGTDNLQTETVLGLSGEQTVSIQSLGDVDPAIFTEVRNYDHEDVAILLPPDQRLGDDQNCNSNNSKKCKKQHQAMN